MGKKLHNEERFRHVSYHHTDLRATFARVRRQQAADRKKVVPIGRGKEKAGGKA